MKYYYTMLLCFMCMTVYSQKKIHVFVALCDNVNQGIVPVPKSLGNGQNARTNLYWGALYGMKTHFKRSKDWELIVTLPAKNSNILERVVFKHKTSNTYLLADAYDGKFIKQTTIDFLKATSGANPTEITVKDKKLSFGGNADLLAYIGHDGLMEFSLDTKFTPKNKKKRDAIILACISKDYFKPYLQKTGANPLVWSTGLMSPEAYTLKWALDGWILDESDAEIRERAAKAYHKYQKCGMRGARGLLVTGY
ncbi:MAG: hypothetical protein AAF617_17535 [Bacteroidota bacterium]